MTTTGATIYELKGSDTHIQGGAFEPNQLGTSMVWDGCGATGSGLEEATSQMITSHLTAIGGLDGIRLRIGYVPQEYVGGAWTDWDWKVGNWFFGAPLVRTIDVREMDNKKNSFVINFTATNMGACSVVGDSTEPMPPMIVNMVSRPRNVNAWRTEDPTTPLVIPTYNVTGCSGEFGWEGTDFFGCTLASIDIGGHKCDIWGKPVPVAIEQTYVTIEQIVKSPYTGWNLTTDLGIVSDDVVYPNILAAQELWVNRRNIDDNLFGYRQGQLLCNDISIQPLHYEYKRVVMSFIADEWDHMEQLPWAPDGEVIRTTGECDDPESEMAYLHADYVAWRQNYLMGFSVCGGEGGAWTDYFRSNNQFALVFAKTTGATAGYGSFTCEPCS